MEQTYRQDHDLYMTGKGSSNGGEFKKIRIVGESDVAGNITCTQIRVMGTMLVRGRVRSVRTHIMGQLDVDGDFNGEVIKVLGQLSVGGDCNSESFKVRGTFTIGGLLNAGKIEVCLFGPCEAKEIGGEKIRVKRNLLPDTTKHLTVETVEGDDIRLEFTRAKVVRGNRVEIGPGCEIELIEYKEHYRQSNHSNVTEARRISEM